MRHRACVIAAGLALAACGATGTTTTGGVAPTGAATTTAGAPGPSPPAGADPSRIALFERELNAMQAHGADGDFVIFTDATDQPGGSCYVQLSGGMSGKPPTYGYLFEASASCPRADASALATLGYGAPGSGGGGDPNYFQTTQLGGAVTNHTLAITIEASFLAGFHASPRYTASVSRSGYAAPSP